MTKLLKTICRAAFAGACLILGSGSLMAREVTDPTGRRVNIPERPERLVSLAPSITEVIFALGLGDRLVGDTDYCDYPPEARQKPHVGALLNPSLERIVALRLDLVLGTPEANHLLNHQSYHRGQVTTLLRQLGATPLAVDFLAYFDSRKQKNG